MIEYFAASMLVALMAFGIGYLFGYDAGLLKMSHAAIEAKWESLEELERLGIITLTEVAKVARLVDLGEKGKK
jgi:uncharacterized protein (DUF2164 family)